MSLRRVRCPHCSRRYDVTGVAVGTRLRCIGCAAILSVPASPAPRRLPLLRVAGGVTAGAMTIAVLAMALRPSPASAPAQATPAPSAAVPLPPEGGADAGFIEDSEARLKRDLQVEFPGARFLFSLQARPFFIALEASDRYAGGGWTDEFAQALELASTVFRREVAERLSLPSVRDTLFPVVVLTSRASFDRYCEQRRHRSPGPGFYDYTQRRMVTYRDERIPRSVLLHEATHQLVHYYLERQTRGCRATLTYWLQEGLPCYFEPFRLRVDGEVGPDRQLDLQRLPMLKELLRRPDRAEFVPLSRLLSRTVDGMFEASGSGRPDNGVPTEREAKFLYAESWALVHFLRTSGPGTRKVFDAYLRRELAGTASRELFEQLVRDELGLTLAQLEDQFVKHVESIP
jgi:hypothetical protein